MATEKSTQIDDAIDLALEQNKNVFLTGPGGCGKTYAIKKIVEECDKRNVLCIATAMTGTAAINFSGRTLHSYLGAKLAEGSVQEILKRIRKANRELIKKTEVLIIDEISMLGALFLTKINEILKIIRKNQECAFGGIVVIASGDFLQLSPIRDDYAFKSPVWKELSFTSVIFNVPYRFIDNKYFDMLQRIRIGKPTENDIKRLTYRNCNIYNILPEDTLIKPTKLMPKKASVVDENAIELDRINSHAKEYIAHDKIFYKRGNLIVSLSELTQDEITDLMEQKISIKASDYKVQFEEMADTKIVLKDTAQIMLTYNLNVSAGLVNGSRCVVAAMKDSGVYATFLSGETILIERIAFERKVKGNLILCRSQLPIILGYALTIHKCQGATLDSAIIDLGPNVFANSQGYVALSRVKSLNGLYLTNFIEKSIKVDPAAVSFTMSIENEKTMV